MAEATSIEIKRPISGLPLDLRAKTGAAVSAGQSQGRVEALLTFLASTWKIVPGPPQGKMEPH